MTSLFSLSAQALNALFVEGKYSSEEILKAHLQRIDEFDHKIGAFTKVLRQESLEQARILDAKRARGDVCGRLAAVPIAIKDSIHLKNCPTTCGSQMLGSYIAPFDATVVEHLRQEDAIFIGKTNLDAFGMGSSTEHSDLKLTKNPWKTTHTPGGSSGGSAAAVAAGFCPIALGSDTGGSIRQPASYCGLFGLKPTYGRVSRYGLIAFASSLEQIGPIARDAGDLLLVDKIISRPCSRDATYLADKTAQKKIPRSLKDLRIGHCPALLTKAPAATAEHFHRNLEMCKKEGAIIEQVDLTCLEHALATYYIISCAEASTNLARFDGVRYGYRAQNATTAEISSKRSRSQAFNQEVKRRILLGTFALSAGFKEGFYKKAQQVRSHIARAVSHAFSICDVIATPTTPGGAFELGSIKDPLQMYLLDAFTIWCNLAQVPALSIPSGVDPKGLPLGFQLIGARQSDEQLIQLGILTASALAPKLALGIIPTL